ncbi:MAG TPA: isoprenylcysteine carboxylmethyltransferase family protein [Pseudonocardia sp.]|nr:isoprenylcysteine carboxylmethyltransferase family protein [Pseudonocardia sp.]
MSVGVAVVVATAVARLPELAIGGPATLAALTGIAAVLLLVAIAGRLWAVRTLGRWFTTDVRTDTAQPVIDAGPYRWVRHPSYTAAMVALLAVGLTFDNWVSLAAMVVLPLIGFGVRIRVEERALLNALGEPYRELSASPTATTPAPTGGWYPASGDRRR